MQAWESFVESLKQELDSKTVDRWVKPLRVVSFDAANLYLEADDSFALLWFEEHVRHRLKNFVNSNRKPIKVHLASSAAKVKKGRKLAKEGPKKSKWLFDTPSPLFTFNSFVTFEGNQLGAALLKELSQKKSDRAPPFNPIYISGRKGAGKSHLLEAARLAMTEAGMNAVYVRAETFTEHVVGAIRSGEMQSFRRCYRNLDALLIDDVEIFAKKGATQEELFHTFNSLHGASKQLVFAASCLPRDLKSIEMRLISRFEWGIVVPLESLPKERMAEALMKKAESIGLPLASEVQSTLLKHFSGHAHTLMRALDALILRAHLRKGQGIDKLTASEIEELLADLIEQEKKAAISSEKILKATSDYFGITVEDILGKAQSRDIALPRQIAIYLFRRELALPYMKIGSHFSRDHSTIISSNRLIDKEMRCKDSEIRTHVTSILTKLEEEFP